MKNLLLPLGMGAFMTFGTLQIKAQNYTYNGSEEHLEVLTPKGVSVKTTTVNENSPNLETINQWLLRANGLMRTGNFAKAADTYTQVLQFEKSAQIYVARGIAHFENGLPMEALSDFDAALNLDRSYIEAYAHKGDVLMSLEFFPTAISSYDEVLSFEPNDVVALNNRGLSYLKDGRIKKAWKDFEKAYQLSEDSYITADVLTNMALCLLEQKDYSQAKRYAIAAYHLNDTDPAIVATLAMVEAAQGHHASAVKSYSIALDYAPDEPTFYLNRARCQIKMGNYFQATEDINQLERLTPYSEELQILKMDLNHAMNK